VFERGTAGDVDPRAEQSPQLQRSRHSGIHAKARGDERDGSAAVKRGDTVYSPMRKELGGSLGRAARVLARRRRGRDEDDRILLGGAPRKHLLDVTRIGPRNREAVPEQVRQPKATERAGRDRDDP